MAGPCLDGCHESMRSWVVLGLLDAFGDCCRTAAIPSNEIAVGTAVLMRSPFFLWLLVNQFNHAASLKGKHASKTLLSASTIGARVHESQSKPGIKMVDPEPCFKTFEGGYPQLFLARIVPY